MIFRHHKPAPLLAEFVDLVWFYECSDPPPHRTERILPSGDMGIVIDLRDTPSSGAILCGAYSEYFTLDTAQQAHTLGIQFKPGGAFPFLKIPAGEFEGTNAALSDVWGSRATELRERLLTATSVDDRFRMVDQALLAMMKPPRDPHPAVAYALREIGHTHRIDELTSQISLSPKRFTDVFRNEVGLTPKLFCRLRRFQQALRRLNEGRRVEWADFALSNGYYDQPHFIRDFQAFSGLNPSSYVPRGPVFQNHVPLPD